MQGCWKQKGEMRQKKEAKQFFMCRPLLVLTSFIFQPSCGLMLGMVTGLLRPIPAFRLKANLSRSIRGHMFTLIHF